MLKRVTMVAAALVLTACGGGGGDPAPQNDAALTGTWIAANDGHYTGSSCGIDIHGSIGRRVTITFDGASYTITSEVCAIIGGNTGFYVLQNQATAGYATGGIAFDTGGFAPTMRAIDLHVAPAYYASYNVTGNQLIIAKPSPNLDGSSPDKRAILYEEIFDPVFLKQ